MKKSIVIILAVAIIGGLGIYQKAHGSTGNSAVQGASTEQSQTSNTMMNSSSSNMPAGTMMSYKDGTYEGQPADTVYGTVQVEAVVSGGKITDIKYLQMPNDRGHTQEVTAFSEPLLKQQTLKNQSASIDFISGATQTSEGYEKSLQAALNQAV